MNKAKMAAIIYAAAAAVFYALSTPLSKILLKDIGPTMMAALLYLGAGVGVGLLSLFVRKTDRYGERLSRTDTPYVIGMVVLDIAAPIALMHGLETTAAANVSLLNNFEIAATAVIALIFFKEHISKRLWAAVLLIMMSSVLLSFESGQSLATNVIGSMTFSKGSAFVLLATLCWGLENNCTRKISEKSTYQIVTIKGLCSGAGSMALALIAGERFPAVRPVLYAMGLGFIAYGLSIFCYIRAQRTIGAAKTSAYYAAAPFIAAILSFVILNERLTVWYAIASLIMAIGTVLATVDTLKYHHQHTHTHVISHTHDGVTHTHVITHTHDHNHLGTGKHHEHIHSAKELEREVENGEATEE